MELKDRLSDINRRIREACLRSGRNEADVQMIAVTKYVSLEDTRSILELGVTRIGESRAKEGVRKRMALSPAGSWHFIGHLQTNKVKEVVGVFDYIHSLDRWSLAEAIAERAGKMQTGVDCLIQLNISGEASKKGLAPGELLPFADAVSALDGIRVAGLMTMAPLEADPEAARPVFRQLRLLLKQLNDARIFPYPVRHLSMGMSHDFEIAVEEGATLVRLGSVLTGR